MSESSGALKGFRGGWRRLKRMKNGLLSVSCLVKSGFKVEFENDVCTISKQGKELVKIPCEDGLFVLDEEQLAA
ncbi:Hypothetical predicted protein, partial [Podarcis lilfordi]